MINIIFNGTNGDRIAHELLVKGYRAFLEVVAGELVIEFAPGHQKADL